MKKIIKILFVLILTVILVSCSNEVNKIENAYPSWYATEIPPQPLQVSNLEEAQKLLTEKEYYKQVILSDSPTEEETLAYEHMIATINKYGKLPLLKCYSKHESELVFFPMMRYEAVGIKVGCSCNKNISYYTFYFVEDTWANCTTVTEYWEKRFGKDFRTQVELQTVPYNSQTITVAKYKNSSWNCLSFLKDNFEIKVWGNENLDVNETVKQFEYVTLPIAK